VCVKWGDWSYFRKSINTRMAPNLNGEKRAKSGLVTRNVKIGQHRGRKGILGRAKKSESQMGKRDCQRVP
jgi:hypothetical protein